MVGKLTYDAFVGCIKATADNVSVDDGRKDEAPFFTEPAPDASEWTKDKLDALEHLLRDTIEGPWSLQAVEKIWMGSILTPPWAAALHTSKVDTSKHRYTTLVLACARSGGTEGTLTRAMKASKVSLPIQSFAAVAKLSKLFIQCWIQNNRLAAPPLPSSEPAHKPASAAQRTSIVPAGSIPTAVKATPPSIPVPARQVQTPRPPVSPDRQRMSAPPMGPASPDRARPNAPAPTTVPVPPPAMELAPPPGTTAPATIPALPATIPATVPAPPATIPAAASGEVAAPRRVRSPVPTTPDAPSSPLSPVPVHTHVAAHSPNPPSAGTPSPERQDVTRGARSRELSPQDVVHAQSREPSPQPQPQPPTRGRHRIRPGTLSTDGGAAQTSPPTVDGTVKIGPPTANTRKSQPPPAKASKSQLTPAKVVKSQPGSAQAAKSQPASAKAGKSQSTPVKGRKTRKDAADAGEDEGRRAGKRGSRAALKKSAKDTPSKRNVSKRKKVAKVEVEDTDSEQEETAEPEQEAQTPQPSEEEEGEDQDQEEEEQEQEQDEEEDQLEEENERELRSRSAKGKRRARPTKKDKRQPVLRYKFVGRYRCTLCLVQQRAQDGDGPLGDDVDCTVSDNNKRCDRCAFGHRSPCSVKNYVVRGLLTVDENKIATYSIDADRDVVVKSEESAPLPDVGEDYEVAGPSSGVAAKRRATANPEAGPSRRVRPRIESPLGGVDEASPMSVDGDDLTDPIVVGGDDPTDPIVVDGDKTRDAIVVDGGDDTGEPIVVEGDNARDAIVLYGDDTTGDYAPLAEMMKKWETRATETVSQMTSVFEQAREEQEAAQSHFLRELSIVMDERIKAGIDEFIKLMRERVPSVEVPAGEQPVPSSAMTDVQGTGLGGRSEANDLGKTGARTMHPEPNADVGMDE
ncbi:uncharacterized protein B0H18DRAFT_1130323 [Fomitopsis serialis]|uniref:uncharacterized protein n=1 Tax=Fomitopsis serialis TaxID=139415 RepID=UPI002008072E|nr:uncharacterized protein B0H18DRAFT_1130323 [Neoantrodia serialis]KAH9910348.1 hypothetical protein B0H18DRAFT_1130323 [Neoantrodia serialis]